MKKPADKNPDQHQHDFKEGTLKSTAGEKSTRKRQAVGKDQAEVRQEERKVPDNADQEKRNARRKPNARPAKKPAKKQEETEAGADSLGKIY